MTQTKVDVIVRTTKTRVGFCCIIFFVVVGNFWTDIYELQENHFRRLQVLDNMHFIRHLSLEFLTDS